MGVNTIKSLRVFERIMLMLTPVKYQPDTGYLRKVDINMVHLFTAVQLTCLFGLFMVKNSSTLAVFFPLVIVAMRCDEHAKLVPIYVTF